MTVAVAVKVFDGLILATDSATTMQLANGSHQVWNNANKIFHLHRTLPVAAMTWGLGNVGDASIATLAKDLRRRFTGKDPDHPDWELRPDYTLDAVCGRLVDLFFDELYRPAFAATAPPYPALGFMIAGYSGRQKKAEAWTVVIDDPAQRPAPQLTAGADQSGWIANAQPEASCRLFHGFDPELPNLLKSALTPAEYQKVDAVLSSGVLERVAAVPAMPFADAIGFARYLVDVTVGYSRYLLGPDTVGGPVEVAGISRHEGFKWVSRKHYYPADLNPEDPRHDH